MQKSLSRGKKVYLVTGPFGVFFVFFVIADPHTRSSRVVTWRCAVHFSFYKVLPVKVGVIRSFYKVLPVIKVAVIRIVNSFYKGLPVKVAVIRIVNSFYKMLLVKVAVISR